MTWGQLQKPITGLHWWYRLLTGRHYNYPVINQKGRVIFWKSNVGNNQSRKPAHLLNLIELIKYRIKSEEGAKCFKKRLKQYLKNGGNDRKVIEYLHRKISHYKKHGYKAFFKEWKNYWKDVKAYTPQKQETIRKNTKTSCQYCKAEPSGLNRVNESGVGCENCKNFYRQNTEDFKRF